MLSTEPLWILVAVGIAIFVAALLWANRRNKGQSRRGVDASEQGARELRDQLDRNDKDNRAS